MSMPVNGELEHYLYESKWRLNLVTLAAQAKLSKLKRDFDLCINCDARLLMLFELINKYYLFQFSIYTRV